MCGWSVCRTENHLLSTLLFFVCFSLSHVISRVQIWSTSRDHVWTWCGTSRLGSGAQVHARLCPGKLYPKQICLDMCSIPLWSVPLQNRKGMYPIQTLTKQKGCVLRITVRMYSIQTFIQNRKGMCFISQRKWTPYETKQECIFYYCTTFRVYAT